MGTETFEKMGTQLPSLSPTPTQTKRPHRYTDKTTELVLILSLIKSLYCVLF